MTKDEELLIKRENIKLNVIKEAFEQNPVYKRMVRALASVSNITINVDELAEAYMSLSSGSNNLNNQDFYVVDEEFIRMILGGVKYEIAQENDIVFDTRGEINVEATIRKKMMGEYNFVDGHENLSSDEILKLSETIEDILSAKPDPNMDKRAEKFWIATGLTMAEQVQILTSINQSKEIQETAKRDIDLTFLRTAEDVKTMNLLFEYRQELQGKNPNERTLRRLEKKILRIPGNERYCNASGEFNRSLAIEHIETYNKNYINKKSLKNLQEIISSNTDYEGLDADTKENLLQSIYFISQKGGETDRTLAIEMLRLIEPEAVKDSVDGEKSEIVDEEFVKLYNDITPDGPKLSMEEIQKKFAENGLKITKEKLLRLAKDVRQGTLKELEATDEITDLNARVTLIEELKERNKEANEFRTYKREYRILKRMLRRGKYSEEEIREMVLGALGKAVINGRKSEEAILRQYAIKDLGLDRAEIKKGLEETNNYKKYMRKDGSSKTFDLVNEIIERHRRQQEKGMAVINFKRNAEQIETNIKNENNRATLGSIFSIPFLFLKRDQTKLLDPATVMLEEDVAIGNVLDRYARMQEKNKWKLPEYSLQNTNTNTTLPNLNDKGSNFKGSGAVFKGEDDGPQL